LRCPRILVSMTEISALIRQVKHDVASGTNLELYVIVPIAVVALILNVTGRAGWLIGPVITALLTMIAVSLLKSRHQHTRLESLLRDMRLRDGLSSRFFWKKHELSEVQRRIDLSNDDVWLWGATLTRHISELEDTLVRAACRGVSIKVLLIPADGDAMRMAATRAVDVPIAELISDLNSNLDKLRRACRRIGEASSADCRGGLEVRTFDYLAPYTLYAYGPFGATGSMELRLGGINADHDARAGFTLAAATDQDWFEVFRAEFLRAWKPGTTVIKTPGAVSE